MVARVINNFGFLKRIGTFPSIKLGRQVWWESPLESDYIHLLEADGAVSFYEEQPFKIKYTLNGKKHYYTPDFLVKRHSSIQIVEVKPEKKVFNDKYQTLFRMAAQACRQEGYEFAVVTDLMIRIQPKLNNIKVLWRYARTPLNSLEYRLYCQEAFSVKNELSLGELFNFFTTKKVNRRVVYALLYWGFLEINLMESINENSKVCLSGAISTS
jgi:hypothetical protein